MPLLQSRVSYPKRSEVVRKNNLLRHIYLKAFAAVFKAYKRSELSSGEHQQIIKGKKGREGKANSLDTGLIKVPNNSNEPFWSIFKKSYKLEWMCMQTVRENHCIQAYLSSHSTIMASINMEVGGSIILGNLTQ